MRGGDILEMGRGSYSGGSTYINVSRQWWQYVEHESRVRKIQDMMLRADCRARYAGMSEDEFVEAFRKDHPQVSKTRARKAYRILYLGEK